jgi:hypothetical protein
MLLPLAGRRLYYNPPISLKQKAATPRKWLRVSLAAAKQWRSVWDFR